MNAEQILKFMNEGWTLYAWPDCRAYLTRAFKYKILVPYGLVRTMERAGVVTMPPGSRAFIVNSRKK